MELKWFHSFLVFAGSYLPLPIILFAQNVSPLEPFLVKRPVFFFVCIFVCLIGVFCTLWFLNSVEAKSFVDIKTSKSVPADVTNYVLPYVVSLSTVDVNDNAKLIANLFLFGTLFVVTHKSGRTLLNPLLFVMNWRVYEISLVHLDSPSVLTKFVLSKTAPVVGERFMLSYVQDVAILKPIPVAKDA